MPPRPQTQKLPEKQLYFVIRTLLTPVLNMYPHKGGGKSQPEAYTSLPSQRWVRVGVETVCSGIITQLLKCPSLLSV